MKTPDILLWVYQSNAGANNPGRAKAGMQKGWFEVYERTILPQLMWLDDIGDAIGVSLHLPFGHWTEKMNLDAYDFALRNKASFFLDEFYGVWQPLTRKHHCIGYVGGSHVVPHLSDLGPLEIGEVARRNLLPLKKAGFHQIVIDTAGEAITKEAEIREGLVRKPNSEIFALYAADQMFGTLTGVEAAPRNHKSYRALWNRPICMTYPWFDGHLGGKPEDMVKPIADGFSVPKGVTPDFRIFVTGGYFAIDENGNTRLPEEIVQLTLAACQRVLREGHKLILGPKVLIEAGIEAKELRQ